MKSKLRNVIICFLLIGAILNIAKLPSLLKERHIQHDIADNVIRLHILADSDEDTAQAHKLLVRDAVLSDMAPYMETATSKANALEEIAAHLEQIESTANDTLISLGDTSTVTLSLSNDYFPEKIYGDMTFPKGNYDALRICIGKAEGHNWWCVMYPTLCFIDTSTVSVPESSDELLKDSLEPDSYASLFDSDTKTVFRFKYLSFLNFLFE